MNAVPLTALAGPVVVLAIAVFAGERALAYGLWGPAGPGSGLLPLICSCLLVVLALIDVAQKLAQARAEPVAAAAAAPLEALPVADAAAAAAAQGEGASGPICWDAVGIYIGALLWFALFLDGLGFATSALTSMVIAIHWAERRPWLESIATSAAAAFFGWLLFAVALSVNLPHGRWFGLP